MDIYSENSDSDKLAGFASELASLIFNSLYS